MYKKRMTLPLYPILISLFLFLIEISLMIKVSSLWMGILLIILIGLRQLCWIRAFKKLKITSIG